MNANELRNRIINLAPCYQTYLLDESTKSESGYADSLTCMVRGELMRSGKVSSYGWDAFADLAANILWDKEIESYDVRASDADFISAVSRDLHWALTHWGNRLTPMPSYLAGLAAFAWRFMEMEGDIVPLVCLYRLFGEGHGSEIFSSLMQVYHEDYIHCRMAEGFVSIAVCCNTSQLRAFANGDPLVECNGHNVPFEQATGGVSAVDLPEWDHTMDVFGDAVDSCMKSLSRIEFTGKTWLGYRRTLIKAVSTNDKFLAMKADIEAMDDWIQREYERLMASAGKSESLSKLDVLTPDDVLDSLLEGVVC